jgi:mono/diheme cytochrome c family protein
MKTLLALLLLPVLAVAGAGLYLWSGRYDIGADAPHGRAVESLIHTLRLRSIGSHAAGIQAPPLDDPERIAEGAEHYAAMCSGCHLAPGLGENEMRLGMYPRPPLIYKHPPANPAKQFWVVKHGIKFTAMPAWGASHDDAAIWDIVAFLQKLPSLSPAQYAQMTAHAGAEHEHHHEAEAPGSGG